MLHRLSICCFLLIMIVLVACDQNSDEPIVQDEAFDREALLTNWADHIIVPSLEAYVGSLQNLQDAQENFFSGPDLTSLDQLRAQWLDANKAWQTVSVFDIGRAEEIGLRSTTNTYPTDTELINQNISAQTFNLDLPSNFDAQGLPALDYLLYGLAESDEETVSILSSMKYERYVSELTIRLQSSAAEVYHDWTGGYREEFIANSGASAIASVDKMVNDFLLYYEKFLRAGKIGIPAGVFSGSPLSSTVEAPYANIYSKALFMVAFETVRNFFEGVGLDGVRRENSLMSYISHATKQSDSRDLGGEIMSQWNKAEDVADLMSESLMEQVDTDNTLMLKTYDELQKAIILLKVDMMQALNIQVDYVDADGD